MEYNVYAHDVRDFQAICDYIEQLGLWGVTIDHEDGSTAPFTSEALKMVLPDWRQ